MKRDANGEIVFERLNVYEVILHPLSRVNGVDSYWECIYEHVKIFTDLDNPITAFSFCNYGRVICYDLSKETPTSKTVFKDDQPQVQQQVDLIKQQFNAYQNCFGYCVLDGKFWLNLFPEILNQIIADDGFTETQNTNQDHLVVYYHDNNLIHISKYNFGEERYEHKIGCNSHIFELTEKINKVYYYNSTKRFAKKNQV